jgi:hypothetical protein
MQNATYLTEKHYGKEHHLWSPCIAAFFRDCKPELPVSVPILKTDPDSIHYKSRQEAPFLLIDREPLYEKDNKIFMSEIDAAFKKNLENDPGRYINNCDIAGINPDMVLIVPEKGVYLLENKPYDSISWTGNQGPNGDYVKFVKWLNYKGIHTEYIIIHSIGVKNDQVIMDIKESLGNRYGSILLEDVFAKMSDEGFIYPGISEDWKEYTEKSHYLE